MKKIIQSGNPELLLQWPLTHALGQISHIFIGQIGPKGREIKRGLNWSNQVGNRSTAISTHGYHHGVIAHKLIKSDGYQQ